MIRKETKEKSIIVKFIIISLCLTSCIIMFVGCNKTDNIKKFYEKLESSNNNCEIVLNVSDSDNLNIKYDGSNIHNLTYRSYEEIIDGKLYTYTSSSQGFWTKDKGVDVGADRNQFLKNNGIKTLLNSDNYVYSKIEKAFIAKEKIVVYFELMEREYIFRSLTIKDDACILEGEYSYSDYPKSVELVIKNVGTTKVIVPRL